MGTGGAFACATKPAVDLLQDVCELSSGGTPNRSNPEYWNGTIHWIKTGEINY